MPEQFTQGPSILQGDIVNNLTTDSSTKPLSAAQGKVLKDAADVMSENLSRFTSVSPTSLADFNSAKTSGYYRAGSSATNAPTSGYWAVSVITFSSGDLAQIAIEVNNRRMYFRTLHDTSTWTSWQELALNSKFENKTAYMKSGSLGYGVLVRSGNVVFFTVYNMSWNGTANTSIISNDSSAVQLAIPSGYKPLFNVEIKEALNGKRVCVIPDGGVFCNETFSGLNLRFSGCWITADAMPT